MDTTNACLLFFALAVARAALFPARERIVLLDVIAVRYHLHLSCGRGCGSAVRVPEQSGNEEK
jgi:hypothetical protein